MKTKTFYARSMREARNLVKQSMGPHAIIISHKMIDGGVEMQAGVEEEDFTLQPSSSTPIISQTDVLKGIKNYNLIDEYITKDMSNKIIPDPKKHSPTNDFAKNNFDDSNMIKIKNELSSLRQALEDQNRLIVDNQRQHKKPYHQLLLKKLKQLGFQEKLCEKVCSAVNLEQEFDLILQEAIRYLTNAINTAEKEIINENGIIALLGPTGVGKTTTIAKLATNYVLNNNANKIGLISTDSYRVAGREQLYLYGRMLNLPVNVVKSQDELQNACERFKDKDLVLIDTAGISQYDTKSITSQLTMLSTDKIEIKSYLTVSATSQYDVLEEIIRAFFNPTLKGCILTKIDECANLGSALSLPINYHLPITYISNGQRVPQDLLFMNAKSIINLAIKLGERNELMSTTAEVFKQEEHHG